MSCARNLDDNLEFLGLEKDTNYKGRVLNIGQEVFILEGSDVSRVRVVKARKTRDGYKYLCKFVGDSFYNIDYVVYNSDIGSSVFFNRQDANREAKRYAESRGNNILRELSDNVFYQLFITVLEEVLLPSFAIHTVLLLISMVMDYRYMFNELGVCKPLILSLLIVFSIITFAKSMFSLENK